MGGRSELERNARDVQDHVSLDRSNTHEWADELGGGGVSDGSDLSEYCNKHRF